MSQPFTPTVAGRYTMEMIVDPDDHFIEANEVNNVISRTYTAYDDMDVVTKTVKVAGGYQWISNDTVDLEITTNHDLDWLIVHVYQYTEHPHGHVPKFVDEIVIRDPSQLIHPLPLPAGLEAGRVTLHVWGLDGANLSNPHSVVEFNYAPPATLVNTGDADYYTIDAELGDTVNVDCTLANGGADMLIWQPNNYWSAQMISCSDTINYPFSMAGEYVVKVVATSANSSYSVMGTRNGVVGRRTIKSDAVEVTAERPQFLDPIPNLVMEEVTNDNGDASVLCESTQPDHLNHLQEQPIPPIVAGVTRISDTALEDWKEDWKKNNVCFYATSVLQSHIESKRPSLPPTIPLLIITLSIITMGTRYSQRGREKHT